MIINLTPHAITIQGTDGSQTTIAPSGTVARVSTQDTLVDTGLWVDDVQVPVVTRTMGKVTSVPADISREDIILVSSMVLDAAPAHPALFAPDTGPTAIRDDQGRIVAVTRLVAR